MKNNRIILRRTADKNIAIVENGSDETLLILDILDIIQRHIFILDTQHPAKVPNTPVGDNIERFDPRKIDY